MTKIKLCGLTRMCDIEAANELSPEYIGFVFAEKSRRYVSPDRASELKKHLNRDIKAVGVFVNEDVRQIASLLECGTIDIAQLHGSEDEDYIHSLRKLTDKTIIKAFRVDSEDDIIAAQKSSADFVLLDSGNGGTGTSFDWKMIRNIERPYFLAGGLNSDNVRDAVKELNPYALDVSSGIETDGFKDRTKMEQFVSAAREIQELQYKLRKEI